MERIGKKKYKIVRFPSTIEATIDHILDIFGQRLDFLVCTYHLSDLRILSKLKNIKRSDLCLRGETCANQLDEYFSASPKQKYIQCDIERRTQRRLTDVLDIHDHSSLLVKKINHLFQSIEHQNPRLTIRLLPLLILSKKIQSVVFFTLLQIPISRIFGSSGFGNKSLFGGGTSMSTTASTTANNTQDQDFLEGKRPEDTTQIIKFCPQPQGKPLIACGGWDGTIRVWTVIDSNTFERKAQLNIRAPILDICWIEGGSKIFMACADKEARLWDLDSNQVEIVGTHDGPVKTCHWINGNNHQCLMTGSFDKTLRFWDMKNLPNQTQMASVTLPERVYAADVMYPMAVVALANRRIKVYNLENGPMEVKDITAEEDNLSSGISVAGLVGDMRFHLEELFSDISDIRSKLVAATLLSTNVSDVFDSVARRFEVINTVLERCSDDSSSTTKNISDPSFDTVTDEIWNKISSGIHHKILVVGANGLEKRKITVNLGRVLALDPTKRVVILDADIWKCAEPSTTGVDDKGDLNSADGWNPVEIRPNVTLTNFALLNGADKHAIVYLKNLPSGIKTEFHKVDWKEVDYLLIDTPQGTSDEHISLVQFLLQAGTLDGALIVSAPQEVSLLDVRKEVDFCTKAKVPILGVVVNMSHFVCPSSEEATLLQPTSSGRAEKMCQDSNLELLAQLPLEPALAKALDNGEDFFETNPDSTLAKSFMDLAEKVKAKLK